MDKKFFKENYDFPTKSRETIGIITNKADNYISRYVLKGINSVLVKKKLSTICFSAGKIGQTNPNVLQKMAKEYSLSGIIIIAFGLVQQDKMQKFLDFINPFSHLPRIAVGTSIPGIPSIYNDVQEDLRELIMH